MASLNWAVYWLFPAEYKTKLDFECYRALKDYGSDHLPSKFFSRTDELSNKPLTGGRKAENIPPQRQGHLSYPNRSWNPQDSSLMKLQTWQFLSVTTLTHVARSPYNLMRFSHHKMSCLNYSIPSEKVFHSTVCFVSIPVYLGWYFHTLCEIVKLISLLHSD